MTYPPMWVPSGIQDLTAKAPKSYRIRDRKPGTVDAAILHQTAMNRGNTPMLYKDEHCHYLIQPDGEILLLHPIDKWIVASSMFNDSGIAIEIVGNFPDDKGNYWNGHVYGQDT